MILTILAVVLLVSGIGVLTFYFKKCYGCVEDWLSLLCIACIAIGAIFTVTFSCMIVGTHLNAEIEYENMVAQKTAIEYRLNQIDTNNQNVLVNGGIYNDILEYNAKLRSIKKWGKNPWTNWFYVDKITELDYIELANGSK